jgi:transposase-like protein
MNWKEFKSWMVLQGYTIKQAARRLGVSHHALDLWRRNDDIPTWIVKHIETIEEKKDVE